MEPATDFDASPPVRAFKPVDLTSPEMAVETKFHLFGEEEKYYGTINIRLADDGGVIHLSGVEFKEDYIKVLENNVNLYKHVKEDQWTDGLQERKLAEFLLYGLPKSTFQVQKRSTYPHPGQLEYTGNGRWNNNDNEIHLLIHQNTEILRPSLFLAWGYQGTLEDRVVTAVPRVRFLLKREAPNI
jgi:hypothetical protein